MLLTLKIIHRSISAINIYIIQDVAVIIEIFEEKITMIYYTFVISIDISCIVFEISGIRTKEFTSFMISEDFFNAPATFKVAKYEIVIHIYP